MADETKTDDADLLRLARERYENDVNFERENRDEALDDLRFRAGDQWPEEVKRERDGDNRPCLTINRMPQFIRQVTGDIRINRPAIKVRPVDSGADPALAEVFTGLIRHIEHQSHATRVYAKAADGAATCGMGHFRVTTEYATDDSFDQDIFIRGIQNPFAVVWDADSQLPTREDANHCFVTGLMGKEAFKAAYPDANMADFESDEPADYLKNWYTGEQVRVAEYWVKKPETKRLGLLRSGETVDLTDYQGAPLDVVREREVQSYKICQYVISGVEVLEGPNEWAGRYIPIISVWGEEVNIGDRVYRHGVIRFAKDSQRMYNYHRSAAVETIALAPKAPFIVSVEQVRGHEKRWKLANLKNLPYLLFNPDPKNPGRPQRERPADVPVAMMQESAVSAEDMKAVTGIYDAALGAKSNETSGKAIIARQQEGDVGTFVYIDNLALAIEHCGRILVDLIPRIYDTERTVRVLGEDDSEDFAVINQTVVVDYDESGMPITQTLNDLSAGKYDVAVTTGPSYSTKRMEAADSLMQFMQAVPDSGAVIADLVAKNMDWPGAEQIADRLRKLLPPGIDEDGPPAPQGPSPEQIEAETDAAKAQADIAKTQADMAKTAAETEGKQLDNAAKQLELAMQTGQLQALVQQEVQRILLGQLGPPMAPAAQPMQPPPGGFSFDPNGGGPAGS